MEKVSTTVKEAVKESLVGTQEPVKVSLQTKARFNSHAVKDPETGELFLGPDEFIDAVAPADEDFVSFPLGSGTPCALYLDRVADLSLPANSTRSGETNTQSSSE